MAAKFGCGSNYRDGWLAARSSHVARRRCKAHVNSSRRTKSFLPEINLFSAAQKKIRYNINPRRMPSIQAARPFSLTFFIRSQRLDRMGSSFDLGWTRNLGRHGRNTRYIVRTRVRIDWKRLTKLYIKETVSIEFFSASAGDRFFTHLVLLIPLLGIKLLLYYIQLRLKRRFRPTMLRNFTPFCSTEFIDESLWKW